ncbi:UNVERIFIED_CONTAM: hypothetical protein K2H54_051252 [Gekko kuhli]
MAQELSQAELLDFLCQAGRWVTDTHFKGFLRNPTTGLEELRRHQELFKNFLNSMATVKQEAPGTAKLRWLTYLIIPPSPPLGFALVPSY